MSRNDAPQRNNPTIGLGMWGPLMPASDCKLCLATLIGLQVNSGALLWTVSRQIPQGTRGKWTNRIIRGSRKCLASYILFMASMEVTRFMLPYDPWVEDAKKARQREDMLRIKYSPWDLREWRYKWFGPSNYHACSWNEWKERTIGFLDRADQARPNFDKLINHHRGIVDANMTVADEVLERIRNGSLEAPDMTVAEMQEQLQVLPDFGDEMEQEVYDEVDLSDTDLWEYFDDEPVIFQSVVMPRSSNVFLEGVQLPNQDELRSQNVNYTPIPQRVKKF